MKKHKSLLQKNTAHDELCERIALVMKACDKDGHVSRKTLMAVYGLTQIQAGVLMRDFIHAHASHLEWHPGQSHYKFSARAKLLS